MNRRRVCGTMTLTIALAALVSHPVSAQINPSGTTALEDVNSGALHGRSPGNMVQEGLFRHNDFQNFDFGITEVEQPSRRGIALAAVLETFFEELNAALQAFEALLIARGGGNPASAFTDVFNR